MGTIITSRNIYEDILKCQKKGISAALVTVIETEGSTPREVGAKMLVMADGTIINTIGGGAVEMLVIKDALETIKSNKARIVKYALEEKSETKQTGMICGGEMSFFIEPLLPQPFLYLFGAGHIGKVMYQLGIMNRFNVIIIDDRTEYANKENFPDAVDVIAGEYNEIIDKLEFKQPAYIVIMTKSHFSDELVLKNILKKNSKYSYLGMVASKIKFAEIREHLKKDGIPEKLINSVYAPVGLPIKSKTPEEIAISIMAEIIKVKNS